MRQKTRLIRFWIVPGTLLIISVGTAQNARQELDKKVPTEEVRILAEIATSPEQLRANAAKIEFRVALAKNQFHLLEPVRMIAKFKNPTSESLEIYEPNFEEQLGIRFSGNEKEATEKVRFKYYLSVPAKLLKLAPGQELEKTVILSPGYNLFGNQGPVEVQFYLSNLSKQSIWSNKINIEVVEPAGINREALDYLLENLGSENDLFTPRSGEEKTETLLILETFLEKFKHSAYSDAVRFELAKLYKIKRKTDKSVH